MALRFEPAVEREISLGTSSERVTIGAVRVPLWSAAFAQTPGRVSLDDVAITTAGATYAMKRIEFSGVTASEADLRAVFDGASAEPLWTRLERIGARQITIPEIVAEERFGAFTQKTVFRKVVANDVERGRIRLLKADESTAEATGPQGKMATVQQTLSAGDLDLAALARIYVQKAGAEPEPFTKVLGSYSVETSTMIDAKGATVRTGRAAMQDIGIRPTQESWSGVSSLVSALSETDDPSHQDSIRMFMALADAIDSVQVGSMEVNGIEMTVKADKQPFSIGLKRMAYTAATPSRVAEVRLEDFGLRAPEGTATADSISYSGFSFEPTLKGLRALKGQPLEKIEELDPATLRSLVPTIGTIRETGLKLDFAVPREAGGGTERLQVSLDEAEFTADRPLNGIPTHLRIAVRHLGFPIPPQEGDDSLKQLLDLGYKTVDLSYGLSASWNEAQQEIQLTDISVGGTEMGQASMKATLGGATRDLFDPDTAVASAAALAATLRSADLTVENSGLLDRYLQQEARKQKKTAEALRREYAAAAAMAVPLMLGNSDQAKALGQAVSRFIAKPTRLRIAVRAKSPAGLGITDAVEIANPSDLLQKLDVTATTDERL